MSFYEKVIKVKADVAALLMFDFRHISTEKFALGSLRCSANVETSGTLFQHPQNVAVGAGN